jgi:hypothetical protein
MPEDIIYKYKARKTLEELFIYENSLALGFDKLVDNETRNTNPTRVIPD